MNNTERQSEWPTYEHMDHILTWSTSNNSHTDRSDTTPNGDNTSDATIQNTLRTSNAAEHQRFPSCKLIQIYSNENEAYKTGPLMNMFNRIQKIEDERKRKEEEEASYASTLAASVLRSVWSKLGSNE